jgi:hypothetical protein
MSTMHRFATVALAATLACTPSVSFAQGRGNANKPKPDKHEQKPDQKHDQKHEQKAKDNKSDDKAHDTVVFDRNGHARVIHEYYVAGSLPPGLAKREQLPPGLRKQLHERGELPPGLQKRLIAVPAPLVARMPPVPPYYHRYFAGDDLIVVDTRTNRIAAIVPDVWR